MVLRPAGQALDIKVVINIHVVRSAVAATRSTPKRECGDQIVVNGAKGPDRSRRIHNDSPGVDYFSEFANNILISREHHRRVSETSSVVHVDADLKNLSERLRSIYREHREQFLDGQRMFAAYALNGRHQELCGSITVRSSTLVSFSSQIYAPRSANFFRTAS